MITQKVEFVGGPKDGLQLNISGTLNPEYFFPFPPPITLTELHGAQVVSEQYVYRLKANGGNPKYYYYEERKL